MYGSLHIWRSGHDLHIRNLCHNINSDFSDPAYMMDTEQFKELTAGLVRLHTEKVTLDNRREEERAERDMRISHEQARRHMSDRQRRTESKLERQITVCSGDCPQAVRTWLSEIELSIPQIEGNGAVVRMASGTVAGALREELERYLSQRWQEEHIAREAVPWVAIKEQMKAAFLATDEAAHLRDECAKVRQSAYEEVASYNRRFRSLANKAYPPEDRNPDQQRILVDAYIKGLTSDKIAEEVISNGLPEELEPTMLCVSRCAERRSRLNRLRRVEEPMELGAVGGKQPAPRPEQHNNQDSTERLTHKLLKQLIGSVEKLHTKQEKLVIQRMDKTKPTRKSRTDDGKLICYNCSGVGHISRDCPKRQEQSRK